MIHQRRGAGGGMARRPAARGGVLPTLGLLPFVLALLGAAAAEDGGGEPRSFSHAPLRLAAGALQIASTAGDEALGDPVAYCLSCHGEESAGTAPAEPPHLPASAELDHPVDVRYPENDPEYRPPSELAPAVLLLDRRLTCLTCHAYDDPGHALVLASERSELCRACHLT